ncbi:hypothetical protein EV177_000511 [Coemansia sp. RSA 1804]|nr:hypothetical protein EV177_000511 [Coemansia sp. RSA 1804]
MLGIRQATVTSGGVGKIYTPTEEITNARTAILYKDNSQTYCEVMMSSQTVGIAAASCFDYVNNEVNPNIGYTVLVSTGTAEGGVSGAYKATKVTHHPDYNPDTYANNIAVMQFTAIPGFDFTKAIADWPAEWKQYFFVHRSLTNVMPYVFNDPKVSVVDVGADDTSGCTSASAIYAANTDNYICNMLTVPSYVNTNCVAPYGSVYGVADPNPAQLGAVFSHSAIYGTSGYCGKGPIYNYYLILRNYIPWIESVSQATVSTYHISGSASYAAASDSGYVMDNPGNTVSGVYVVGNYTAGTMVSAVPVATATSAVNSVLQQSEVDNVVSTEMITFTTTDIVAISNENTGIVAASCIDYVVGNVNENVKYSVVVSPNLQLEVPRLFNVNHIKPHPDYNPETFANNIAVLQISMIPAVSILKGFSDRIEDWDYNVFHHRSLINGSPKGFEFNLPATTTAKPADQDVSACSEASAIYSLNPSDFICNSATLKSYVDSSCMAPYGSVYSPVEGQGLLLCALFSHSVVYSDEGYCGDGRIYNYYVILRNYIPWIKSVAVGSVQTYNTQTGNGYVGPTDIDYKMREPTENVAGAVLMGNYTLNPPPPSSPNLLESTRSTVSDLASAIRQEDPLVSAIVSKQEEEDEMVTSIVLSTIIETDIYSSTYVQSSTEINSVTTTIPETTTIDVTDYVSETSVLLKTSTVMVTLTTVELSIVTVTATELVPTVIEATNSIISPVIISVTDVSILTVGNGEVVTVTKTAYNNLSATGDISVVDPASCDAVFATETVSLDASTVYITNTVTESGAVFTSVSTATFTDYEFITLYTTDTVVSTADVILPASESSETPTAVGSSEYPAVPTSNKSDEALEKAAKQSRIAA